MDNKNLDKTSKGWTLKNILIGGVCVAIGWLIGSFNAVFGLATGGDSGKLPIVFYVLGLGAVFLIGLGILGFWVIIPAFQKWRHTKYEWIAWVFFAIAIFFVCVLIYFRNISI